MSTDILLYLAAFAGGFLGAAFGALIAFVFTGFAVLVGIAALIGSGDASFLNEVAFGPFFGPHISFAGGVGAAAYAGRKGWLDSGRDIVTPLVSLAKPTVLIVGGVFGVLGVVVAQVVALVPWFGSNTDGVALTVVVSALIARLLYGKTGVIGAHSDGLTGAARFRPTDTHNWVRYQEAWPQAAVLGLGVGMIAAWAAVALLAAYPEASGVIFLGFGVSAASLTFLAVGLSVPVTHHITIIGALGASSFLGVTGSPAAAVLIGTGFAVVAALVGEGFARFWLIRGDTHIDPPASTIWPMTTLVLASAALFA
ncbi:MAG: hypothetical protein ACK5LN_05350 [Propioniciclava sp.]